MTPAELSAFCAAHGGRTIVAKMLPCSREHLAKMCKGERLIGPKTVILVERLRRELEQKENE